MCKGSEDGNVTHCSQVLTWFDLALTLIQAGREWEEVASSQGEGLRERRRGYLEFDTNF